MKRRLQGVGLIAVGVCAGVAMVVSCNGMGGAGAKDVSGAVEVSPMANPGGGGGAPVKAITADTDATRLSSGMAASGPAGFISKVVRGPFILTDLMPGNQGGATLYTTTEVDCPPSFDPSLTEVLRLNGAFPIHAGRFLVPNGITLCAEPTNGGMYWMGFEPY